MKATLRYQFVQLSSAMLASGKRGVGKLLNRFFYFPAFRALIFVERHDQKSPLT
jgi:hypothetical protein